MSDLQKTIEDVQLRINSLENRRRLELQAAANRKEKVFTFQSWGFGGGVSLGDSNSPISGMSIRDMVTQLGDIDAAFAEALIQSQLQRQIELFDTTDSDVAVATQIFSNMALSWLHTTSPAGEVFQRTLARADHERRSPDIPRLPQRTGSGWGYPRSRTWPEGIGEIQGTWHWGQSRIGAQP